MDENDPADAYAQKLAEERIAIEKHCDQRKTDPYEQFEQRYWHHLKSLRRVSKGTVASRTCKAVAPVWGADQQGRFAQLRGRLSGVQWRPTGPGRTGVKMRMMLASTALVLVAAMAPFFVPSISEAAARAFVQIAAPLPPERSTEIKDRLTCAMRTQVRDATGQTVGFLRVSDDCGHIGDPAPKDGALAHPGFRTAEVSEAAAAEFSRLLQVVEGAHEGAGTVLGVNLAGLARGLFGHVRSKVFGGKYPGGSTSVISGLEVLFDGQTKKPDVREKLATLFEVAQLSAGELAEKAKRDRFVTLTTPVAMGPRGSGFASPIAGGVAPWAIFGKERHEDLSLGEMCVLVAAAQQPLLLLPDDADPAMAARVFANWHKVAKRALARCLVPLEDAGEDAPGALASARSYLEALIKNTAPAGSERPSTPIKTTQALPTIGGGIETLNRTVPGIRHVLADVHSLGHGGGAVTLHVSAEGQQELAQVVDGFGADLPSDECIGRCGGNPTLDVLATAVRIDADAPPVIAALWANSHNLWHGPWAPDGHGRKSRGTPHRPVASLVKALAAPRFVADELTSVCRRSWQELHDTTAPKKGYENCAQDGATISLARMMAISSNLGFADAIATVGTGQLVDWFSHLGAFPRQLDSEAAQRKAMATATALPMTPEAVMRAWVAILRGSYGEIPQADWPHLVARDAQDVRALPEHYFTATHRKTLRSVLAAPITSPSGTLHTLSARLEKRGCVPASFMGKTGTSESTANETAIRDRLVMFHAECGGHRYAVFAMIGRPDTHTALEHVSKKHVLSLALGALDAARTTTDLIHEIN